MIGSNDISRDVYGLLGIPIDPVDMPAVLHRIENAAALKIPFLISTANLNFLIASQFDREFRKSLLSSDLCTADGMPIIWLAHLLDIPIKQRIAGSDIFEALKATEWSDRPLKVFLFGGAEGVAASACKKLNDERCGLICVGAFYPGFGTLDEISTNHVTDMINASGADFLAVALGAKKGQAWLLRNHDRLRVPVRVHLGATLNFQAGTIKRAPGTFQRWGIEWLWRIKEEPQLWKRYRNDGIAFLRLLSTRVIPLLVLTKWERYRSGSAPHGLQITRTDDHESVIFSLNGAAVAKNVDQAVSYFNSTAINPATVVINFAATSQIDARFLGLLLMLDKLLKSRQKRLQLVGVSARLERYFRLNGFEFLLRPVAE